MTEQETSVRYPPEALGEWADNGTMPQSLADLGDAVIRRRITSARRSEGVFVIELDNGTEVEMLDSNDCCAYTELDTFLVNPELVDHAILGVGTTGEFTMWHIYADMGDVLQLTVDWSCGNPFYYGYGFDIAVRPRRSDTR